MSVTMMQVMDAVAAALAPMVVGQGEVQSYDELTDGVGTTPLVQVYMQHAEDDSGGGENRTTFGSSPLRQRRYLLYIDVLAEQRGVIAQNMTMVYQEADRLEAVLDAQNSKPLFNLAGIQSLKWFWDRVTIQYGSNQYAGLRCSLSILVF